MEKMLVKVIPQVVPLTGYSADRAVVIWAGDSPA